MKCSDCGKGGATLRRVDAALVVHYWHLKCWRGFCAWLREARWYEVAR